MICCCAVSAAVVNDIFVFSSRTFTILSAIFTDPFIVAPGLCWFSIVSFVPNSCCCYCCAIVDTSGETRKIADRSIPTPKTEVISTFLLANCLYAFIAERSQKTIKAIVHQRYVTLLLDALLFMGYDLMFSHHIHLLLILLNYI